MTTRPTDADRGRPRDGQPTWALPAVAVALGVAYLIAGWIGDNLGFGLFGLGLMVAIALALVLLRRRSETVQGLIDARDERINALDQRATAFAGMTVITAVIVAFLIEVARGADGQPYAWLGAIGGIAYVAALTVLRLRS